MKPKITCSILCYNYGRFLAQAIESCLNQTIDRSLFEVLVIDDGSTDETPEICARYGNQIRVSRTHNQGFGVSLSRGIQEAYGEYVAYLDADDYWAPTKLERLLPIINKDVLVVMHPMIEIMDESGSLDRIGACGNTSSVCIQKEAALTLLPATTEIYCKPLLDIGKGKVLKEPLGYYRIHDSAMTARTGTKNYTTFFAQTSHVTADRLFQLVQEPPFWAQSSKQVEMLAHWYRTEGYIKEFELTTELKESRRYIGSWVRMIAGIIRSRRWPGKREARLTIRAILQVLHLKQWKPDSVKRLN